MADRKEQHRAATNGAGEVDALIRQRQLQELVFTLYGSLESTAYESHPGLDFRDCERVLQLLSGKLGIYTGPIDAVAFEVWASDVVTQDAARFRITTELLTTYSKIIHAAIHKSRIDTAVELSVEHADIYQEVAALIFAMAHKLAKVGSAKLSTRLTALVLRHVKLYHSNKNNRRHRLNRERLDAGLPYRIESISAQELAAEDFAEK